MRCGYAIVDGLDESAERQERIVLHRLFWITRRLPMSIMMLKEMHYARYTTNELQEHNT